MTNMNNQEYDQKKRECWEEFWDEISGNIDFAPGVNERMKEHIYDTFDRAYALGKQEKDATMQQDYKSGELECWCDFCNTEIARRNSFDRALVRAANNFAFFRGYRLCKQEKDADTVIQGWVARDEDGSLTLFYGSDKPSKKDNDDYWSAVFGNALEYLPQEMFSDVKWEDAEPTKVELIIKRKKNE